MPIGSSRSRESSRVDACILGFSLSGVCSPEGVLWLHPERGMKARRRQCFMIRVPWWHSLFEPFFS